MTTKDVYPLHAGYFSCFYCRLVTFFIINFFKQLFQEGSTRVSNGVDPGLGSLKVATSKEIGRTNRQHCITTLGFETLHNLISEALLNGEVHPNRIKTTWRCFFCGLFMLFLSCFCYAFVRVCLLIPCGHLLGKG